MKENTYSKLYIVSSVILAAAVSVCLIVSVQVMSRGYVSIGGCSMFRVVTGSMEPTLPLGTVLISQKTDIAKIQQGDIVCYRTRVAEINGSIVTHRVVSVQTDKNGTIYLETRGDANLSSDPYYVDSTNLVGRVIWFSGKESAFTNMLSFLSGKTGFLICIVFPVLLIAGLILQNAVRNLRRDLAIVKYELTHEQTEKNAEQEAGTALLPGYTMLTYADYEEIYESLRKELLEELNGQNQKSDTETEK